MADKQGVTVQDVWTWLDEAAPFHTAEDFDNAGLLLGDLGAQVHRILFCVDVTPAVLDEAHAVGAELIVSHHPLMFGGISRLHYADYEGRVLLTAVGERLNLIAAHTNLDKAHGGIGDTLAEALELAKCKQVDEFVRMGTLQIPMEDGQLAAKVSEALKARVRQYGEAKEPISQVAVAPGAYGVGAQAALQAGAQAYVVGEIKHHEILAACAQGLVVLEAGHFATEAPGMAALFRRFKTEAERKGWDVQAFSALKAPFAGALLL